VIGEYTLKNKLQRYVDWLSVIVAGLN